MLLVSSATPATAETSPMMIIAQIIPYSTAEVPRQSLSICVQMRFISIDFLLFGICSDFSGHFLTNSLNRTINVANFSTALLVVAVALLDESGQVLLQKRREKSVHGGLWEFPGGKIEHGELAQLAASREISEELGLMIDPEDLDPLSFASGPGGGSQHGGQLVILLYTCSRWTGTPTCQGGELIAWYRADQLAGLAMPPLDYPLAAKLAEKLIAA
ncbi:MAG: NUDIX domain-containing protein [Novosphingobium sp.]|nr:NUDIX domain-containing protein [Novosphingobium sp.]